MNLNELTKILICPTCGDEVLLKQEARALFCMNCFSEYEIYDGKVPIMVNTESREDIKYFYQNKIPWPNKNQRKNRIRLLRPAPDVKLNYKREKNLLYCLSLLTEKKPKILTIGNFLPSGKRANKLEVQVREKFSNLSRMDIIAREEVDLVGDGHKIPLISNYFDLVVAQATIKHLKDPIRFIEEIHRILRPRGIFYCEVAYLLPYHRWPGDYVRFTPLGVRQLLKEFRIIDLNYIRGPSQTVADILSIYVAILLSFKNRFMYSLILKSTSWILHPIKYFDYLLQSNPWADLLAQVNYCIAQKVDETPDSV